MTNSEFYDNNGNQTSRGADSFTWDHENRMTSATISGATSSYVYNGDGVRTSKTSGGVTTQFTWSVRRSLPVILDDGSNQYTYGLGLIGMIAPGGVISYFLPDGLGSTANVTDASGTVTATYCYDVFGSTTMRPSCNSGSSTDPFLFTGEQKDNESGYSYLRARYYDPATGRFVSRDPLGGGYVYANNNPVRLTDPSGLFVNDPSEYDSYADYLNAYAANHGDMATNWDGQGPPGSRASSEGDSSGGGCHFVAGGMDCGGTVTALTPGSTFYLGAGYNAYVVVDSMGDASALYFNGPSSVGPWLENIGNIDTGPLIDPVTGEIFAHNSPWEKVAKIVGTTVVCTVVGPSCAAVTALCGLTDCRDLIVNIAKNQEFQRLAGAAIAGYGCGSYVAETTANPYAVAGAAVVCAVGAYTIEGFEPSLP